MRYIFYVSIFIFSSAYAQKNRAGNFTVYVNYPDYNLKTEVLAEPFKKDANKSLEYYWYASNKVIKTQGGYDGKVLNGCYTAFYLSGNLKEKGAYVNGVKDGEWTSWYSDGKICEIINWKRGVKSGELINYDQSGNLMKRSNYKKGVLDGEQTEYEHGKVRVLKYKRGSLVEPKAKRTRKEKKASAEKEVSVKKHFLKQLFNKHEKVENSKTEERSNQNGDHEK